MRSALHFRTRIDRRCIIGRRDGDMADRMTDLFLKFSFGLPGYTGIHAPLHDEQRCLPMMNMRQRRRTVPDLRVIDRLFQRIAAGLGQSDFDLPGDTLEFGIRHGQSDAGLASRRGP